MAYHTAISLAKRLFDYGATLGFDMDLVDIGGGFLGQDIDRFKKVRRFALSFLNLY